MLSDDQATVDENERASVFVAVGALVRMADNHTVVGPRPPTPGELIAEDASLAAVCQVSSDHIERHPGKKGDTGRRKRSTRRLPRELLGQMALKNRC